jgi:SAM-dependent methyltransferase
MSHPDATDFWSDRYRAVGEDFLFGTAPNRFLASQAALLARGRRALSIADGEGRNAVWLAGQGLQVTAKLAAAARVAVDFIHADALNWDYPEAGFDLVVGVFIQFAAPAERDALFANMKRALRPGGRVVLQGYTPKQLDYRTGGPSAVENLYTPELLRGSFADCDIELLTEYEDVLDEGLAHRGRSALIGMVARRI